MSSTRTKALGVGVVVLLAAAAVAAFSVGSSDKSTSTANLARSATVSQPNSALVDWISSTIRVRS